MFLPSLPSPLHSQSLHFPTTDEDREGEAISWHLVEILKPKVPFTRSFYLIPFCLRMLPFFRALFVTATFNSIIRVAPYTDFMFYFIHSIIDSPSLSFSLSTLISHTYTFAVPLSLPSLPSYIPHPTTSPSPFTPHICFPVPIIFLQVPFKRAVFHEITKDAILKSFENPREIDMNIVQSQETRRLVIKAPHYYGSMFNLDPPLYTTI